jgi:arabinose-5-phosphate isomerase
MGKAGHIGQKLAATFTSTGTRAHFLHPAEAIHGDLGRIGPGDVVLALSQSGETAEIVGLLPSIEQMGVPLVAVTASRTNTLGAAAEVTIELGRLSEACSLGLAPTTSTTAMLGLGDALALVVSQLRGFEAQDFAKYHPGGSLGLKLSTVEDYQRNLSECRVALETETIRTVLTTCSKPGRRTGAIMLVNQEGALTGLFTDSDLVRLIEHRNDGALDRPVSEVMIQSATTVLSGTSMIEAINLLADRKISELPVIDAAGKPVGLIDITDVMGLLPARETPSAKNSPRPEIRIYGAADSEN